MPDTRFSRIRRTSLREGFTLAVAAAGLVAVAASSAISVADDSVATRIAVVADEQVAVGAHEAVTPPLEHAPAAEAAPIADIAPIAEPVPAPMPAPAPPPPPAPVYADNLDGWIHEALDIMAAKGIPGTYDGIRRNIMRESTGNPQAINLWDTNAAAGIPSKGLLQVIDPTFAAFHVDGTPFDVWHPVANIVAACNYAAHRYGSMDNVDSAY